MATSVEFMEYVAGQLAGAGSITYRKMFGEYGVYYEGKIFALVCDNQLFLKPTQGGKRLLTEYEEVPPYEGAKPYLLIDELDDRELLAKLVQKTCQELPVPKEKKPGKKRK